MSLALPETLTLAQAGAVLAGLERELAAQSAATAPGEPFEIDASALQSLDTSTLAVLLQCRRQARAAGREVRLVRPPAKLLQLMQLYGVDELLPRVA